jgi:hypothetical protein
MKFGEITKIRAMFQTQQPGSHKQKFKPTFTDEDASKLSALE